MLNANQKKFLRIHLRVVEDELMDLRRLLLKGEKERLFLRTADDLTQEEKRRLVERMDRLTENMLHLKNIFDLAPEEKDLRQTIKAASVYLAVDLEETMSEQLRGRGEIAPELKETLDPILGKMISVIHDMGLCIE